MVRCNGYSHMKILALKREEWKSIFHFRKEEDIYIYI